MSGSLRIDPDEVRRQGHTFRKVGDDALRTLEGLISGLAAEGRCWGDDEAGKTFERSYRPDAEHIQGSLRQTAQALRRFGVELAHTGTGYENLDQDQARTVRTSADALPAAAGAHPTGAADVAGSAGRRRATVPTAASAPDVRQPTPATAAAPADKPAPAATDSPDTPGSPAPTGQPADAARSPSDSAPDRRPDDSVPASNDSAHRSESDTDDARGRQVDAPVGPANSHATTPWGGRSHRAATPWRDRMADAAPAPPEPGDAPGVRALPDRKGAGTPWSKPGAAPRSPTVRPSRTSSGRHPHRKNPAPATPVAVDSLDHLARMLVERHGVTVDGFDTPDIDAGTVREFVAAVDDILTRHSELGIHRVEIATFTHRRLVQADRRREVDADGTVTTVGTVALNLESATERDPLVNTVFAPNSVVGESDTRTVYSQTVRELRRVFDIPGDVEAPRTLVGDR